MQIHTFQLIEILISACLNIDVILTFSNPFNRSHNLKKILVGMKIGVVSIFIFSLVCVFEIMELCEENKYNVDNGNSNPYKSWD